MRNRFVRPLVGAVAGPRRAALLPAVDEPGSLDPNVRPEEADRIRALIASRPT